MQQQHAYHKTFKMKPADVKDYTYIDSSKEGNDKDPTFQVSDHVGISKTKTFSVKNIIQIGLKFLLLQKLKTVPWTYINFFP